MNITDTKKGELYNIQALAAYNADNKFITFELPTGTHITIGAQDFEAVSPQNGIKNTEKPACHSLTPANGQQNNLPPTGEQQTPQYDPCRKFRKGDKVRLREYNWRAPFDNENFEQEEAGQLCIIAENEDYENAYSLHVWKLEDMEREPDDGERPWFAFPLMFIELVTPAEELAPYTVETSPYGYTVNRGELILATYNDETHPNAYAAACVERDRLNAEHRKEQKK